MAKVNSFDTKFGKCEIHISIKTGLFEVRPLDKDNALKINSVKHFPDVKTYDEALNQIEEMNQIFLSNFRLNRKVIIIQLQTSISDYTMDDIWLGKKIGDKLTDDKISDGSGFIVKWSIAEEYKLDTEKDGYNNTLYKIFETSKNFTNKDSVLKRKPNTLHQTLFGGGEKRIVTYREDLHEWLKSLEEQIKTMLEKMLEFFDRDSDKFIQNFTERKFMLGSGNNEKK